MTRYTENQGPELPELTPIEVTLHHAEAHPEGGQYGPYLAIDWLLPEEYGDGQTVRDMMGISVNINPQTGKPAKMRSCLNALAGKPDGAKMWFDDGVDQRTGKVVGPPEWGYDSTPQGVIPLTEGLPVVIFGRTVARQDGQGEQWRIQAYQAVRRRPAPAAAPRQRQTNVQDQPPADPDEGFDPDAIPF